MTWAYVSGGQKSCLQGASSRVSCLQFEALEEIAAGWRRKSHLQTRTCFWSGPRKLGLDCLGAVLDCSVRLFGVYLECRVAAIRLPEAAPACHPISPSGNTRTTPEYKLVQLPSLLPCGAIRTGATEPAFPCSPGLNPGL